MPEDLPIGGTLGGGTKWRTILVLFLLVAFSPGLVAQHCPSGTGDLICHGKTYSCVPSGTTCCASSVGICSPGQFCGICNSQSACVANGSQCCFSAGWCGPGTYCRTCSSSSTCVQNGHACPKSSSNFDLKTIEKTILLQSLR